MKRTRMDLVIQHSAFRGGGDNGGIIGIVCARRFFRQPKGAARKPVPSRDARSRPAVVCPLGHFLNPSPQRVVG